MKMHFLPFVPEPSTFLSLRGWFANHVAVHCQHPPFYGIEIREFERKFVNTGSMISGCGAPSLRAPHRVQTNAHFHHFNHADFELLSETGLV